MTFAKLGGGGRSMRLASTTPRLRLKKGKRKSKKVGGSKKRTNRTGSGKKNKGTCRRCGRRK
jgi:hypothetical protein